MTVEERKAVAREKRKKMTVRWTPQERIDAKRRVVVEVGHLIIQFLIKKQCPPKRNNKNG